MQVVFAKIPPHKKGYSGEYYDQEQVSSFSNYSYSYYLKINTPKVIKKGTVIKKIKGDISNLKFNTDWKEADRKKKPFVKEIDKTRPVFGVWQSGLGILINDTWTARVVAKEYNLYGKNYGGTLNFKYYDHYGLDKNDIISRHEDWKMGIVDFFILNQLDKDLGHGIFYNAITFIIKHISLL